MVRLEARRSCPSHSNKQGHLTLLVFLAKLELYRRALPVRRNQAPGRGPLKLSASRTPINCSMVALTQLHTLKHNRSVKVGFHVDHHRPSQDRLVWRAEGLVTGVRRHAVPPAKRVGRNVLTPARTASMRAAPSAPRVPTATGRLPDGPVLRQVCLTGTLCDSNEGDASGVRRKIDYQGPPDDQGAEIRSVVITAGTCSHGRHSRP
jgi:hypothetical protein